MPYAELALTNFTAAELLAFWNSLLDVTGVTAGTPGSFQPSGVTPPPDLSGLQADAAVGTTAYTGQGAWSTGEYVVLGDASNAYWNGSAWVAGTAP